MEKNHFPMNSTRVNSSPPSPRFMTRPINNESTSQDLGQPPTLMFDVPRTTDRNTAGYAQTIENEGSSPTPQPHLKLINYHVADFNSPQTKFSQNSRVPLESVELKKKETYDIRRQDLDVIQQNNGHNGFFKRSRTFSPIRKGPQRLEKERYDTHLDGYRSKFPLQKKSTDLAYKQVANSENMSEIRQLERTPTRNVKSQPQTPSDKAVVTLFLTPQKMKLTQDKTSKSQTSTQTKRLAPHIFKSDSQKSSQSTKKSSNIRTKNKSSDHVHSDTSKKQKILSSESSSLKRSKSDDETIQKSLSAKNAVPILVPVAGNLVPVFLPSTSNPPDTVSTASSSFEKKPSNGTDKIEKDKKTKQEGVAPISKILNEVVLPNNDKSNLVVRSPMSSSSSSISSSIDMPISVQMIPVHTPFQTPNKKSLREMLSSTARKSRFSTVKRSCSDIASNSTENTAAALCQLSKESYEDYERKQYDKRRLLINAEVEFEPTLRYPVTAREGLEEMNPNIMNQTVKRNLTYLDKFKNKNSYYIYTSLRDKYLDQLSELDKLDKMEQDLEQRNGHGNNDDEEDEEVVEEDEEDYSINDKEIKRLTQSITDMKEQALYQLVLNSSISTYKINNAIKEYVQESIKNYGTLNFKIIYKLMKLKKFLIDQNEFFKYQKSMEINSKKKNDGLWKPIIDLKDTVSSGQEKKNTLSEYSLLITSKEFSKLMDSRIDMKSMNDTGEVYKKFRKEMKEFEEVFGIKDLDEFVAKEIMNNSSKVNKKSSKFSSPMLYARISESSETSDDNNNHTSAPVAEPAQSSSETPQKKRKLASKMLREIQIDDNFNIDVDGTKRRTKKVQSLVSQENGGSGFFNNYRDISQDAVAHDTDAGYSSGGNTSGINNNDLGNRIDTAAADMSALKVLHRPDVDKVSTGSGSTTGRNRKYYTAPKGLRPSEVANDLKMMRKAIASANDEGPE